MILLKQKCCLLWTGVSTESPKGTSVLQLRQVFLATRNMTRINVGLVRSYVKLFFRHGIHMCAIWWHGISTNSGDSYGHQLCSTYSRFIFNLLREGLYVWPSKVFNDNSPNLDDIFTIDNPKFEKLISDIYPAELQLNKANTSTSDKETSFIETTIGLVLGPCTALYRLFLKHCTLTNKAVGTIWRALSKPPQRRQGPDLRPLWLLVGTPSAIRPELAFSRAGA